LVSCLSEKIIKIIATRCHILRINAPKSTPVGALPQTPLGELTALLQTPHLDLSGSTSNRRQWRGRKARGGKRRTSLLHWLWKTVNVCRFVCPCVSKMEFDTYRLRPAVSQLSWNASECANLLQKSVYSDFIVQGASPKKSKPLPNCKKKSY